jgi:hypothetical protein
LLAHSDKAGGDFVQRHLFAHYLVGIMGEAASRPFKALTVSPGRATWKLYTSQRKMMRRALVFIPARRLTDSSQAITSQLATTPCLKEKQSQ